MAWSHKICLKSANEKNIKMLRFTTHISFTTSRTWLIFYKHKQIIKSRTFALKPLIWLNIILRSFSKSSTAEQEWWFKAKILLSDQCAINTPTHLLLYFIQKFNTKKYFLRFLINFLHLSIHILVKFRIIKLFLNIKKYILQYLDTEDEKAESNVSHKNASDKTEQWNVTNRCAVNKWAQKRQRNNI